MAEDAAALTDPSTLRLPHFDGPTVRALALRAFFLWLIVRITLLVLGWLLPQVLLPQLAKEPVQGAPSVAPSIAAVVLVAFLSDMDVRITREALFLAHIGIGRRHIAAIAASVALAGELAVLLATVAIL